MRQKKRFTEHEWILLEEKFNDLLPPPFWDMRNFYRCSWVRKVN